MKIGDLVKCVNNNGGYENSLTVGKTYVAVTTDEAFVGVMGDTGKHCAAYKERFELVNQSWITDRPPTEADADDHGQVAITWITGRVCKLGYKQVGSYLNDRSVLAWAPRSKQPLPPAYVPPIPTSEDLKNGPIDVQVSESGMAWYKRKLVVIHKGKFYCEDDLGLLAWKLCRRLT